MFTHTEHSTVSTNKQSPVLLKGCNRNCYYVELFGGRRPSKGFAAPSQPVASILDISLAVVWWNLLLRGNNVSGRVWWCSPMTRLSELQKSAVVTFVPTVPPIVCGLSSAIKIAFFYNQKGHHVGTQLGHGPHSAPL